MFEGQSRKPPPVGHAPCRPPPMLATVTKQKTLKMLPCTRHDLPHDAAQPDQVAHGFMIGVRHPDGRQLSGAMKSSEHGGVATICLHSIARLHRNQRRRHHVAPMTKVCKLAMNAITARSGLITKRQRLARTSEDGRTAC